MIYTVEFYSEAHGEVLYRTIEAPDRNMSVEGICRYYRVGLEAIRSVKETPDAALVKLRISKVSRIPGNNKTVNMSRRPWTEMEDMILRAKYSTTGTEELCRLLKRTPRSVYSRAHLFGLKRDRAWLVEAGMRLSSRPPIGMGSHSTMRIGRSVKPYSIKTKLGTGLKL